MSRYLATIVETIVYVVPITAENTTAAAETAKDKLTSDELTRDKYCVSVNGREIARVVRHTRDL
jgi:hypothetical protein